MQQNEQHHRALLAAICQGDQDAMRELYALHGLPVLSFLVNRLGDNALAEEVLQDVMLAVWKGACKFRGESSVRTWLLSIAHHKAANVRQHRVHQQETLDEQLADYTQIETLLRMDDVAEIQESIQQLPAVQIETLELIFYHELSGTQAASVLNIPLSTVKTRLYRALDTLRKLIKKEEMPDV